MEVLWPVKNLVNNRADNWAKADYARNYPVKVVIIGLRKTVKPELKVDAINNYVKLYGKQQRK